MPRRGRMRAPSRSASSPAGAPRGSPTQTLECLLAQKTGAELLRTSFTVLIETALFWGKPQPPSFAMAALAAICSAAPEKLRFSGFPYLFNPQAGRARLPARKFPAFSRKFCLDAPFGAARLRSQKRPKLDGFQPPSFAMAALAAICSASFLLWPLPEPTGVPFRSTSTKKRLSWSGPSSPVRRYFSTWPLSRWTSS